MPWSKSSDIVPAEKPLVYDCKCCGRPGPTIFCNAPVCRDLHSLVSTMNISSIEAIVKGKSLTWFKVAIPFIKEYSSCPDRIVNVIIKEVADNSPNGNYVPRVAKPLIEQPDLVKTVAKSYEDARTKRGERLAIKAMKVADHSPSPGIPAKRDRRRNRYGTTPCTKRRAYNNKSTGEVGESIPCDCGKSFIKKKFNQHRCPACISSTYGAMLHKITCNRCGETFKIAEKDIPTDGLPLCPICIDLR